MLERDHKRFVFTTHGKRVLELARVLLLNANELVEYAKNEGGLDSGSVRLGCIPTIAPFLLTDLVHLCQQKLPKLDLYLCENTTENLMQQLEQGEIDCAILAFPIPKHDFSSQLLGKDQFFIAGDKKLVDNFRHTLDYASLPEKSTSYGHALKHNNKKIII